MNMYIYIYTYQTYHEYASLAKREPRQLDVRRIPQMQRPDGATAMRAVCHGVNSSELLRRRSLDKGWRKALQGGAPQLAFS